NEYIPTRPSARHMRRRWHFRLLMLVWPLHEFVQFISHIPSRLPEFIKASPETSQQLGQPFGAKKNQDDGDKQRHLPSANKRGEDEASHGNRAHGPSLGYISRRYNSRLRHR